MASDPLTFQRLALESSGRKQLVNVEVAFMSGDQVTAGASLMCSVAALHVAVAMHQGGGKLPSVQQYKQLLEQASRVYKEFMVAVATRPPFEVKELETGLLTQVEALRAARLPLKEIKTQLYIACRPEHAIFDADPNPELAPVFNCFWQDAVAADHFRQFTITQFDHTTLLSVHQKCSCRFGQAREGAADEGVCLSQLFFTDTLGGSLVDTGNRGYVIRFLGTAAECAFRKAERFFEWRFEKRGLYQVRGAISERDLSKRLLLDITEIAYDESLLRQAEQWLPGSQSIDEWREVVAMAQEPHSAQVSCGDGRHRGASDTFGLCGRASGASTEEPPKTGRVVTQRVKVSPSALFSEEGLEQGESVVETERTRGEAKNGERTVEMVHSSFGTGEKKMQQPSRLEARDGADGEGPSKKGRQRQGTANADKSSDRPKHVEAEELSPSAAAMQEVNTALSSDSAVATEPHVDYLDHCHVASPVEPSSNPAASASRAEGRMEQQDAEGVVPRFYNTEGLQSAAQRTGLEQGPLQVPHVRKDKRSDKGEGALQVQGNRKPYPDKATGADGNSRAKIEGKVPRREDQMRCAGPPQEQGAEKGKEQSTVEFVNESSTCLPEQDNAQKHKARLGCATNQKGGARTKGNGQGPANRHVIHGAGEPAGEMESVLGPDATLDSQMTAHMRRQREEEAARVLLLEQQEAALILRHQHEQENLRLEQERERLRLKQEREKAALAAGLELDQETAALAASLKRKRALEGEEMRKGRERTTAVLAALQEKRGLTEGTLQAMEVEARSRPKGMDEWASAQQGRRGLQAPFEPVRPSVTGGRYAVLESEVATPSEHGAFNMLEKGRHWKNLPKEHTASVSITVSNPTKRYLTRSAKASQGNDLRPPRVPEQGMAKERGGSPASVEGMQDSGLEKRKRAAMKGSTPKVMAILLTLHLELCKTNNLGLCVLQSFRWSASNVKKHWYVIQGNNALGLDRADTCRS